MKKILTKFVVLAVAIFISFPFILPSATYADGSKIAFSSNRDGNMEIYIMNIDGSNQSRLTNNLTEDRSPSLSPNSSKIAFRSNRDGNDEIYIMDIDGSNQTNISNNLAVDSDPSFSPDGSKITFSSNRDGNYEIYIMNIDGSGQIRLTNNTADDAEPAFSHDSSKIAFDSRRDGNYEIYIMNVDGSGQTNLSNYSSSYDWSPSFSPDGSKIAFVSGRNLNNQVYIMNADGSGQTMITNTPLSENHQPSFSPDGSKIAFDRPPDANPSHYDIYIMNIDGSGLTRLTNNLSDGDPSFPVASSSGTGEGSSTSSKPLTAEELVLLNLTIGQQADLYGKTTTGFVKTLFDNILGRVTDESGLNNWIAALDNGTSPSQAVYNLVFSTELQPKISSMSPEEFVTFLYKNVFDRNPDPSGYANWVSLLKSGKSKEEVLSLFLNCYEFDNICKMFGLKTTLDINGEDIAGVIYLNNQYAVDPPGALGPYGHAAIILKKSDSSGVYYSFDKKDDSDSTIAAVVAHMYVDGKIDRFYLKSDEMNSFLKVGVGVLPSGDKYTRYISVSVAKDIGNIMFNIAEAKYNHGPEMYNLYTHNCNQFVQEILRDGKLNFDPIETIPNNAYDTGISQWSVREGFEAGSYN